MPTWILLACLPAGLAHFALLRGDPRPSLSGPEETRDSPDGRFRVHFTRDGVDAPGGGDRDGDGTPDAVERILAGLAIATDAYAAWRPLIPDGGDGGSDAIDVYVRDIDANGYAYPAPPQVDGASSCFVEIDGGLGSIGGGLVESVVVHELHHCVQYRYTVASDPWIYEASATAEQYTHVWDDGLALALNVLWRERLLAPDRAIDDTGGRFEYSAFVLPKLLEDVNDGDASRHRGLWDALAEDPEWEVGMDRFTRDALDWPLGRTLAELATWNAFACANDDGAHYRPDTLPCTIDVAAPETPVTTRIEASPARMTSAAFRVDADGSGDTVALRCDPIDSGAVDVALVARDADGRAGEQVNASLGDEPTDLALERGLDPDGSALVVLASTGDGEPAVACEISRVPPFTECGCGTRGATPAPVALAALLSALRRRPRARTRAPRPAGAAGG